MKQKTIAMIVCGLGIAVSCVNWSPLRRTPISLDGVEYKGSRFEGGDGNSLVYFDDGKMFINRDRNFNAESAGRGDLYDVRGYSCPFWGNYSTSIVPTKANSQ
jgi:hypothetical protein